MVDLSAIRGILFDKDGTLIELDSMWLPAWEGAAHHVATRVGQPGLADAMLRKVGYRRATATFDPNATLLTGTVHDIVDAWETVLDDKAPADLEPVILKVFAEASTRDPVPVTDVRALLRSLRRRGYILGAATNDSTRKVQRMIDHLGLADDLAFHCGADAGHGGKPGPGMGLAFCEETGIPPERVLMVGDSIIDALMSRAAGFGAAVGVRTGGMMTPDQEQHFDVIIDSIDDLPALLDRGVAGA
ncbi:MAG: HAD family hydrolase [bacterium]|nr:HAD family hydrolase [bacterium]